MTKHTRPSIRLYLLYTYAAGEACISAHLTEDDRFAALLSFAVSQGFSDDPEQAAAAPDELDQRVIEWLNESPDCPDARWDLDEQIIEIANTDQEPTR